MGYSVSPETVERIQRELDLSVLAAGKPCKWQVTKDPLVTRRKAFRIREALSIAARFPQTFPELARAAEHFAIHIVEDGLIEARWKVGKTESSVASTTPTFGGETHGIPVPSVSLRSAGDVIDSWRRHLPSSDPLHFTSTALSPEELLVLYTWAQENGLMLLVDSERETLTVSLIEPSVLEFAWHPPQEAAPPKEEFDL